VRSAGQTRPLDGSGTCTPTQLLPSLFTLGTGFSLPAGYPQGLEAQVVDNCGAPQTSGTVFVQFNDGEQPVKLQSLGNGIWDGTWPVGTQATSQVTLTVTALNPAAITGQSQINGALGSASPPPTVMDQGVLSATASPPTAETPLVPGGLISIYGQQLSDGQSPAPGNVALPPVLAGTTVLIGSQGASAGGQFQSMPMLFASSGQVNAQVPFEVSVNTNQQLILQRDYTYAAPVYVDVAAAQPGIFQSNQQAVIYDVSNNLIGPGNPAHAGDTNRDLLRGIGCGELATCGWSGGAGRVIDGSEHSERQHRWLDCGGDIRGAVAGDSGSVCGDDCGAAGSCGRGFRAVERNGGWPGQPGSESER
jgi:uncharacterized protein (TIGR03437 family)